MAFGLADALIVPLLVPAYDAPKPREFNWGIALPLAVGTTVSCIRSFRSCRAADRMVALLTGLFAIWVFYVSLYRTA